MTLRRDIIDLTTQLSQALDHNYDVINMEAVMSVITTLEGTFITKEQLETTRLAKYINQLRRRTKNEHLARRAKTLLKKWREMLGIQQGQNESTITTTIHKVDYDRFNFDQQNSICEKAVEGSGVAYLNNVDPKLTFTNLIQSTLRADRKFDQYSPETFIMEQSSNSSIDDKNHLKLTSRVITDPIIIDIQDSDSESNLKDSDSHMTITNESVNTSQSSFAIIDSATSMVKCVRRKKCQELVSAPSTNFRETNRKKNSDQSMEQHSIGNISEMLALSNSSSNFFNIGNEDPHHIKTDLSFAGKLKNLVSSGAAKPVTEFKNNLDSVQVRSEGNCILSDTLPSSKYAGVSCRSRQKNIPNLDLVKQDNNLNKSSLLLENVTNNATTNNELSVNYPNCVESKIPKKRGRKRGSKGVDSIIALESSISSQLLINSIGNGSKKVKTTKELYAEIENRKASLEVHNQNIPTDSSVVLNASQVREAYSGNEDSNSISNNSEKSLQSNTSNVRRVYVDSSSESQFQNVNSEKVDNTSKIQTDLSHLELELLKIINHVGPTVTVSEIEENSFSNQMHCSCTVIRVETAPEVTWEKESFLKNNNCKNLNLTYDQDNFNELDEQGTIKKTEDICEKSLEKNIPIQFAETVQTRSIFDLDFEEDEDPLNEIKAEVAANFNKGAIKTETEKWNTEHFLFDQPNDFITEPNISNCESSDDGIGFGMHEQKVVSQYKVEEDPSCAAKEYYQTRISKITEFHISSLHNFYVAGINGNWDESNTLCDNDITSVIHKVVPKYGSLEGEFLTKNFSKSLLNNPRRPLSGKIKDSLPFLGVAFPLYKGSSLNNRCKYGLKCNFNPNCTAYSSSKSYNLDLSCDKIDIGENKQSTDKNSAALQKRVDHYGSEDNRNKISSSLDKKKLGSPENDITGLIANEFESSRRNSNTSDNSLKLTQKSINFKIKQLRLMKNNPASEKSKTKRKRKHIYSENSKQLVFRKHIKNGINGDTGTHWNMPFKSTDSIEDEEQNCYSENNTSTESSKSETDSSISEMTLYHTENEENISPFVSCEVTKLDKFDTEVKDDDYCEVFTKDPASDNHIVLTIKKNSEKDFTEILNEMENEINNKNRKRCSSSELVHGSTVEAKHKLRMFNAVINNDKFKSSIFEVESYKQINNGNYKKYKKKKSIGRDLFHPEELIVMSKDGYQEYILNKSSSNSCSEEDLGSDDSEVTKNIQGNQMNNYCEKDDAGSGENVRIQQITTAEEINNIEIDNHKEVMETNSQSFLESHLEPKNNGNLLSFNNICENLSIKSGDVSDENKIIGNNATCLYGFFCEESKKFKEWHQVLQLQSYNNELLTVLPYVVLE